MQPKKLVSVADAAAAILYSAGTPPKNTGPSNGTAGCATDTLEGKNL